MQQVNTVSIKIRYSVESVSDKTNVNNRIISVPGVLLLPQTVKLSVTVSRITGGSCGWNHAAA